MHLRLFVFCFLCLLFGCAPNRHGDIEELQPVAVEDLAEFPMRVRGLYQSVDDGTLMRITDQVVRTEKHIVYVLTSRDLNNQRRLVLHGDSLLDRETKIIKLVRRLGDSVLVDDTYYDTLFRISDYHVLREDKGYLFLNYQVDVADYRVKLLFTDNSGFLCFSQPQSMSSIDALEEIAAQEPRFDSLGVLKSDNFSFGLSQIDTAQVINRKMFQQKLRFVRVRP